MNSMFKQHTIKLLIEMRNTITCLFTTNDRFHCLKTHNKSTLTMKGKIQNRACKHNSR